MIHVRALLTGMFLLASVASAQIGGGVSSSEPIKTLISPSGVACAPYAPMILDIAGNPATLWACNEISLTYTQISASGSSAVLSVTGVGDISVSPANGMGNVVVSDSGSGGGNQPGSGCGIQYTSGLSFTVGACTYSINGVQYTSPLTNLTLTSADPTNPRIDAIAVDNLAAPVGEAIIITGVPAANPATPSIDPATQLALDYILVPAGATTPGNVTTNTIYDENTEWTSTCTAHLACASTNNPYHLTKDIEGTAAVLNNNVQLVDPAAGTVDLATQNSLVFYIRSKGQWPTGASGATAARTLSIFWKNGSTVKGVAVTLRDGAYGFSSANTTSYQQISIPASAFGIFGIPVTTLEIQVAGPAGSSSIGFYLDWITLQAGINPNPPPSVGMNFRGIWNSSVAYNVNDTVNTANGNSYVALVANTNVAVTTTSTWAPLSPTCGTGLTASGVTCAVDTSVILSRATDQAGTDGSCIDASGSGTTYVCSLTPALTVYTQNQNIRFVPQTTNSGAATVNVNGLGPIPLEFNVSGTLTALSASQITGTFPYTLTGFGSPVTAFVVTPNNIASSGTTTIASGTSALGTGSISSGACASAVTTSATGVATTDNIMADFNADPTSSTGYSPSTSGMLTIIKYPTSNNVNFKVCNNTGSSITPSAITLNWRVVR